MAKQPEPVRRMRLRMAELRQRAGEFYKIAADLRSQADEERDGGKGRRAEEGIQRARATVERARAAIARRDAWASGDQDPDERDRLADLREWEADERDRLADLREAHADEEDRRADIRRRAADQRDREADRRDRFADERDRQADARDRVAFQEFAQLVLHQKHDSGTWTTNYYRMSSPQMIDAAIRDLSQDGNQTPSRVLGYANKHILRVDHLPGRLPDAAIHDIDPDARRLPEPPPRPS